MKSVKKQLWTFFTLILIVSMTMVTMVPMIDIASASPDPCFQVDPLEVRDVSSGESFTLTINVTDAPLTYGWGVYISWDPDVLELVPIYDPYKEITVKVQEGDFLDRRWFDDFFPPGQWVFEYETLFVFAPSNLTEANLAGEMYVTCSLKGDVTWAGPGDGWLATLNFTVEAVGTSVLNLFDTFLGDYLLLGSPAPTYYTNLDGFFANTLYHNIVVDNVERNDTEMWANDPENVAINVTVTNEGNYTETSADFNVTVYADVTPYEYTYDPLGKLIKTTIAVGDEIVVGTETVPAPLAIGATTTLYFTWDTSGVKGGNYTISAEVKGDDDTRGGSGNLLIDGQVLIREHDLNVTDAGGIHVHVGEVASISVDVLNEGTEPETFDITVYADADLAVIGDEYTIGTIVGAYLDAGADDNFDISWNTTGVTEDNYFISGYVPPVADPPHSEMDTADNTGTGSEVYVYFLSDIRGPDAPAHPPDGEVDMWDFGFFGLAYGKDDLDPDWWDYAIADIRGPEDPGGSGLYPPDGQIDMWDFGYAGLEYGSTIWP